MLTVLAAIIVFVILSDQITKILAVAHLQPIDTFPIIRNVLHLTYVENRGAAFGMLSDRRWVFMVVSSIAIVGLGIYLFGFCRENRWIKVSLAMIIGGGIGNMIDRVRLGYVVDFVDFRLIDFAVFNVADSFVTVGAGILIVFLLRDILHDGREKKHDGK